MFLANQHYLFTRMIMTIYKITNTTNGKVYIGKTNTTTEKRWKRHLIESKHHDQRHLYRAINKYRHDKFTIEQIETCSFDDGGSREKHWIKYYNSMNRSVGYNLTEGGENGIRSEEYRKSISKTLKQYYRTHPKPPNPTKGKFGAAHHFYGKHHTKNTREKLSIARRGKRYEDVMPKNTAAMLKTMHSQLWVGNRNPSFKQFPIEKIIELVHTYPLITASEIAIQHHVSYPTVLDQFKRHTGMTFEQYKKVKFGFNHGIYKHLKNLGIDTGAWTMYSSEEQYKMSCKNERSNNTKNT